MSFLRIVSVKEQQVAGALLGPDDVTRYAADDHRCCVRHHEELAGRAINLLVETILVGQGKDCPCGWNQKILLWGVRHSLLYIRYARNNLYYLPTLCLHIECLLSDHLRI